MIMMSWGMPRARIVRLKKLYNTLYFLPFCNKWWKLFQIWIIFRYLQLLHIILPLKTCMFISIPTNTKTTFALKIRYALWPQSVSYFYNSTISDIECIENKLRRLASLNWIVDDSDFKLSEFDRLLQYESDYNDRSMSTIAISI